MKEADVEVPDEHSADIDQTRQPLRVLAGFTAAVDALTEDPRLDVVPARPDEHSEYR